MRTLVVGGSVIVLVQIAAVLLCWRLGAMRSRAEPFAEQPGPSVWDALDRHLKGVPGEVLVHDTDAGEEPDEDAEHFVLWRAELLEEREIRRCMKRMERQP